jgi:CheY-like chemotaxis protein
MTTGKTVLVVDDDEEVREIFASVLSDEGYAIITAGSAAEALSVLDQRVDLMLTDIRMPGGDGFSLARAARKRFERLQIVYVSGWVEFLPPDHELGPLLTKPVRADTLCRAVRQLLNTA